ncbi:GAF and ANTAR domain-containing protein [Pseudonocardia sp. RS11V-5]|uniref:GAF and ANTAR domain-containing protein n=1 Tax=Pseudonocardia terrae TaxID=2905831 RepID=UPI001E60B22C|nr:GAF and ANTAR domain-containing protein [Pseudonocardia terrae]MCE3555376.1 GAF and ANTAR domain-containing protein [Pseudonocardia terrae]
MPEGGTADVPVRWAELAQAFDLVERTLGVLDEELGIVGAPGVAPGDGSGAGSVRGSGPEAQENRAVRLAAARLARARAVELRRRQAELVERSGSLHAHVARVRRESGALLRHTVDPAPAPDLAPAAVEDPPDLVELLEETTRTLLTGRDTDGVCVAAVEAARRAVPAAPHVGLLLAGGDDEAVVRAATDRTAELVCALQGRLGEGPGPDALHDGAPIVVHDLGTAEATSRWPGFASPATRHGVTSVAAFPLVADSRPPAAALVLFAPVPGAFGAAELARGRLCAAQAAMALAGALQAENLVRALGSRDLIGQAKGVLMHTHGIDEQAAFELLRHASRNTNTKLVEVARRTVAGATD